MPVTLRREPDLVHGFVNAVGLGGRAAEAAGAFATALRAGAARRGRRAHRWAAATLLDAPG